jgi:oxygen-dependent protoporphyrinogen oxidase
VVAALDDPLARALREFPAAGVAVVAMAFRKADLYRDLAGYGAIVDSRENLGTLGVLWDSSVFEGRAPEGHALLRVLLGGWRRPEIVALSDDELVALARRELVQVMRESAEPLRVWTWRWPEAIAQYTLGHAARVSRVRERASAHPGLELCGTSYDGISLSAGVASAERCARQVFEAAKKEAGSHKVPA